MTLKFPVKEQFAEKETREEANQNYQNQTPLPEIFDLRRSSSETTSPSPTLSAVDVHSFTSLTASTT